MASYLPVEAQELIFTDTLAHQLPPLCTVDETWYAYGEGTWREISRSSLRPAAQQVLPAHVRTERLASRLLDHLEGRVQTKPEYLRSFYSYDAEGNVLINVANGIIRLNPVTSALDLLPHDPELKFTQHLAASYDPAKSCPLYRQVLEQCLPDPQDRRLHQLFSGYLLLPDCRFDAALCCYGESGTGKSTVADPISDVLGGDLVQRLSLAQLCDPKGYHVPKLRHAAVNLATELDALEVEDSAQFKSIVSGEAVAAREIYGRPMKMRTTAKMCFLANMLPRFKNGTDAEVRRTRFLLFDEKPAQKDVTLRARLREERDGVLHYLLEGLRELLTLGEMPQGGVKSQRLLDRFTVSNDPLHSFIQQRCELNPERSIDTDRLSSEFAEFCEEHGFNFGENSTWFYRHLYQRYPSLRSKRICRGGETSRYVLGLRVIPRLELDEQ